MGPDRENVLGAALPLPRRALAGSAAGKALEALTLAGLVLLVPRALGPADYGGFAVALATATGIAAATGLGGPALFARVLGPLDGAQRGAVARALVRRLGAVRGAAVAALALAAAGGALLAPGGVSGVQVGLVALAAVLGSAATLLAQVALGMQRSAAWSLRYPLENGVIVVGALVLYPLAGLDAAIGAIALGGAAALALGVASAAASLRGAAGAPRSPRGAPGAARSLRGAAGAPRSPRGAPGAARSLRGAAGAPRSPRGAPGAARSLRGAAGAPRSPRGAAGAPRSPRGGAGAPWSLRGAAGATLPAEVLRFARLQAAGGALTQVVHRGAAPACALLGAGAVATGHAAIAAGAALAITYAVMQTTLVALPGAARAYGADRPRAEASLRRVATLAAVAVVPSCAVLAFVAEPLLAAALGNGFRDAAQPLRIALAAAALAPLWALATQLAALRERPEAVLAGAACGAVAFALVAGATLPGGGASAAAAAMVAGVAVTVAGTFAAMRARRRTAAAPALASRRSR